jgi:transporter family-2 protein
MSDKKHQRLDFLAALSGFMIPLQARANGELSHQLGNGVEAALFSFGSGLIIVALFAISNRQVREGIARLRLAVARKAFPRWTLFAGMLGGTFVAIQTHVVPFIGVAIYTVASLAGQTATSLLVDRMGLTGGGKKHITSRRILAATLTVFAVFVSVLDRINAADLNFLFVSLACIAGAVVGIQRALNGRINEYSQQSFATSLLNFIMGTTFLVIFLTLTLIFGDSKIVAPPAGPWWMYTGGFIGVMYIAWSATIVQHLGVLTFTLFSVGGQLVSSLLIDLISPTHGVRVSWYLVAGILLSYLGVIAGGARNSRLQK